MALKVGELFAQFNVDSSGLSKQMGGIEKQLKGMTGNMMKGMLGSQIITKAFSALTSAISSSVAVGMEFEAAMSQVAAISGATDAELAKLTETARHYGETTKFTATNAAEALNYMALAGWDTQQSIDALGGVLNLAASSGMELGAASDAVTDYLSAFGMEAKQAGYMADLMSFAQARSNTTAAALADAYGNCASAMHAAGQDIETTTAMLMALANQGVKGSEAGTAMAAVMRDITQKMDKGSIKIGKTAVAVQDASGNFRDLNDIMADVSAAVSGMGTAESSAALMETFTARSIKAVNIMLNEGMTSIDAYEQALRGSEGTAAEQSEKMLDNLQGDIQIFQSSLESLQITASESFNGVAREITQLGSEIVSSISQAGQKGGIDGMLDEAVASIPKILPKITQLTKGVFQKLAKTVPDLVRGLVGQLPDIISGMSDVIPDLADAIFEGAGSAIEIVIARLPEFAGSLAKAFGNLFVSALKGVGSLVFSGIKGIDQLLGIEHYGFSTDSLFEALFGGELDEEYLATIKGKLDGEIDATPAISSAENAIKQVREALATTTLTESNQTGIALAVAKGSGFEALEVALRELKVPESAIEDVKEKFEQAMESITNIFANLNLGGTADANIKSLLRDSQTTSADLQRLFESYGIDPTAASNAATAIENAMGSINGALSSLGLSPEADAAIRELANSGATKEQIEAALKGYGVDETTASAAADTISNSMTLINGVIAGLGIDKTAQDHLTQMAASGATKEQIQAALEAMGVDSSVSEAVAQGIIDATNSVNAELLKLGIDPETASMLTSGTTTNQALIEASLRALGVPEGVISEVLASYDTIAADISGKLNSVYDDIYKTLTDGKKDTPDVIEGLENEVKGIYKAAVDKVNGWVSEELANLDVNSATYEQDAQAIIDKGAEMTASLQSQEQTALDFITSMAGKSASIVSENKGALDQMLADSKATLAEIDAMTESSSKEYRAFQMVRAGATSNADVVGDALDYAFANYQKDIASATEAYEKAVHEFEMGIGDWTDESLAELQKTGTEAARSAYESRLATIFSGILTANNGQAGMDAARKAVESTNLGQAIMTELAKSISGETPDLSGISVTDDFLTAIFNTDNIDSAKLLWQKALGDSDFMTRYMPDITEWAELQVENAAIGLEGLDDTGLAEAWSVLMENGYLDGTKFAAEGFDPMQMLSSLFKGTELEQSGKEAGQGYGKGLASASIDGDASTFVSNSEESVRGAQQSGSPAAAFMPIGEEAAQGYGQGMAETDISSYASTLVRAAISAVRTAMPVSTIMSMGRYFAQGLANGIRQGKSLVIQAATEVAKAAIKAANDELNIGSPSKVMMETGRYFDEGLALGISKGIGTVTMAAGNLAANAADALSFTTSIDRTGESNNGSTARPGFDYDRLETIVRNLNMVMVADEKRIAQVTTKQNQYQAGAYQKRLALATGRR